MSSLLNPTGLPTSVAVLVQLLVSSTAHGQISMQAAPAEPRVNGAPIVAIRPSTPLLHRLAATGTPPLAFAVEGLPAGLSVDATTGIISGTTDSTGEHTLTVTVSNAAGSISRNLVLAVGDQLAQTPPMGWNSYDSFDDSVTESETLEQAEWLRDNLQPYGWDYVVVDFRWYDEGAPGSDQGSTNNNLIMDEYGRLQPSSRFPSAAGGQGLKPLADQIHAMGLKFGLHIMRGMARHAYEADTPIFGSTFTARDAGVTSSVCLWNADMYGVTGAAGQAWYDSIFSQYAAWGVDYIKVDDMTQNREPNVEYHQEEVELIQNAIHASGRSIVFSLSPGETPLSAAAHASEWANLWRVSDDFWDRWGDIVHIFDLSDAWQIVDGPGHWPDADMLPLGRLGPRCPVDGSNRTTRFTEAEQVTMLSLWSLLPSPLMLGANMVQTQGDFMLALLTNEEVLAVNQDLLGVRGKLTAQPGSNQQVWAKPVSGGRLAVGLFNLAGSTQTISATFADLGISGSYSVRDLWQRSDLGAEDTSLSAMVASHGASLLLLTPPDFVDPLEPTAMDGAGGASVGGAAAGGAASIGGAPGIGGAITETGGAAMSQGGQGGTASLGGMVAVAAGGASVSGGMGAGGGSVVAQDPNASGGAGGVAMASGTGGSATTVVSAGGAATAAMMSSDVVVSDGSGVGVMTPAGASADEGCGCRMSKTRSASTSLWMLLCAGLSVLRRQRSVSADEHA